MGRPQNNPSIGWVHPKSKHVHPLTWGNKNIIFKNFSKRNQNPSRYNNSITNLQFQHKPKYHFSKILV
jgi:hypothetical protein